jgi:hypothetical protein
MFEDRSIAIYRILKDKSIVGLPVEDGGVSYVIREA